MKNEQELDYLYQIASSFKITGEKITLIEPYGEGHINSTFLVVSDNVYPYIFQKINHKIFKDIKGLMNNICLVLDFLKEEITKDGGDPSREAMIVIPTFDNQPFFYDKNTDSYYRMYKFVEDSVALQTCSTKELFRQSAEGFALFAKRLANFDASQLVEPIPNFHNSKKRFEHFIETLQKDSKSRAASCKEEIQFILTREKDYSIIVDLIEQGEIPLRVTHNDTKLNNILFDKKTMNPLCVIDLDTIMPGSILYDFGDSIRFGCNSGKENERDLTKVNFLIDYFEAFAAGFLQNIGDSLTKSEIDHLAMSAKIMTLECGTRFLDDYLDGDHYFKTHFDDENLVRSRTQFKLVSLMEKNMDLLNKIIADMVKSNQKG